MPNRVTRADLAPIASSPKLQRALEEVLNGAILGGASGTGAQTPTLGANKPGDIGGDPFTWVTVIHEGVECVLPLWRRNA